MKGNISKFYLSIVVIPCFIACSSLAVSAEEKQGEKVVDESIDEVIVTGIRASLESALEASEHFLI